MNTETNAAGAGDQTGSAPPETNRVTESDILRLNREIAYMGRVGRRREEYCREQVKYMQACHRKISQDQLAYAKARGENISCRGGCSFCCRAVYVGATLQECEAVAYYLASHELLLARFLGNYPEWREAVRRGGDQFQECERLFNESLHSGGDKKKDMAFEESLKRHNRQGTVCPFLDGDLCSIYEARPSNCAGFFVTHPPERCRPQGSNEPRFNLTAINEVITDISFYYKKLERPVTLYMPVAVYRILSEGFLYLARFPGLAGLDSAALSDPEVRAVIQSWTGSSAGAA